MNTRGKAEAILAQLPLGRPVSVADVDREAALRRMYSYTAEAGNLIEVEIDGDPSPRQLADLVTHLPLPEDRRMDALALMAGGNGQGQGAPSQGPSNFTTAAKGTGLVAAGAAILELVHQLGVLP